MVLESAAMFLGSPFWMFYAEIAAGIVIGVSVIDKALYFIRAEKQSA
jgi:hypothetical protein